jgi:nucleoid DNA-binding protein
MVEHGMTSKSDVLAMLAKLSECIPELVAQGYSVKLDGIGVFYPTIANKRGGADSPEDFSVSKNVAGVRFRFKPDSTDLDDLTSKTFGKHVTFGQGYYQTETGKKAPKIHLAAFEPEP